MITERFSRDDSISLFFLPPNPYNCMNKYNIGNIIKIKSKKELDKIQHKIDICESWELPAEIISISEFELYKEIYYYVRCIKNSTYLYLKEDWIDELIEEGYYSKNIEIYNIYDKVKSIDNLIGTIYEIVHKGSGDILYKVKSLNKTIKYHQSHEIKKLEKCESSLKLIKNEI